MPPSGGSATGSGGPSGCRSRRRMRGERVRVGGPHDEQVPDGVAPGRDGGQPQVADAVERVEVERGRVAAGPRFQPSRSGSLRSSTIAWIVSSRAV